MQNQTFKLSLKPNDYPPNLPFVYADQYDVGRTFVATVYDADGTLYNFTTETVTVVGTKPSGTGFLCPAAASGNTVTFETTGQMTVVAGDVTCGIIIEKDGDRIGTLHFVLHIQPAALSSDTIIDASDFDAIIANAIASMNLLPTDTASGAVASFPDGANNIAVQSLTVDSSASQLTRTGKNILPYPYYEAQKTVSGITFTVNEDGTITANGTATAQATFTFVNRNVSDFKVPAGSYVATGCPAGGSSSTYRIRWARNNASGAFEEIGYDSGSGLDFSVAEGEQDLTLHAYINIPSGSVLNNVVFSPMLRPASFTDDTYEPYTGKTYSVTDGVVDGEVTTLLGANNIWSDTGDTTVEYRADTGLYIDKKIAEVQALVLES